MAVPSLKFEVALGRPLSSISSLHPIAAPRVASLRSPLQQKLRCISDRTLRYLVKASSVQTTTEGLQVSLLLFAFLHPFFFLHIKVRLVMAESLQINAIPTKPVEGQKTGTSGLRKKVFFFLAFLCCVPVLIFL